MTVSTIKSLDKAGTASAVSGAQSQTASTDTGFALALQDSLRIAASTMLPSLANGLQSGLQAALSSPTPARSSHSQASDTSSWKANPDTGSGAAASQQQPWDQSADTLLTATTAPFIPNRPVVAKSQDSTVPGRKNGDDRHTDGGTAAAQQTQPPQPQPQSQPQQQIQQPASVAATQPQTAAAAAAIAAATGQQNGSAWLAKNQGGAQPGQAPVPASAQTQPPSGNPQQAPVATQAQAATLPQAQGQTQPQSAPATAADQQANSLARTLAGTGAALKVEVKTAPASQQQPASQDAGAATPGTAVAQQPAQTVPVAPSSAITQGDGQGQGQGGQDPTGGNNANQTNDQAAQQMAAAGQAAATSAPGKVGGDAPSFEAQVAAQIGGAKGTGATQQTQGAPQAQPLAGLGGPAGVQAAQKAAPTQAAQAATPPKALPQNTVMDQVSVEIGKHAADGTDLIKVQLKPAELGRIEIKLEVGHDGQVAATVTADNKDTLSLLQKDASGLTKALADAGLKADTGSLSFNLRGEQQQQQQASGNDGGQGRTSGRQRGLGGLNAVGDVGMAAAVAQNRPSSGRSGVDISV